MAECTKIETKEQIEEMARDICHLNVSCDECTMLAKQMGQSKERYCKAMQYANRAYEKGYRKQSEWISVEDRLPEKDGNYITFTNATGASNGVIAMKFVTATVRGQKVRRWEWSGRISPWVVTHWMPLPEPPKMKGE